MSLLTRNNSSPVGVRSMDDQHGILMDTINELSIAVARGAREQVCEILDRLIEFTRMHFWSVEQLMEQTGFPAVAEHRIGHHSLLARMIQSAHRVQYDEEMGLRPLLCDLSEWYADHIEGPDQQYGIWMNERGLY